MCGYFHGCKELVTCDWSVYAFYFGVIKQTETAKADKNQKQSLCHSQIKYQFQFFFSNVCLQFFSLFRLCSLSITRLTLMMPLPMDLTSLSLAVKMQSSKRTLRSHEIPVPQSFLTGSSSGGIGSAGSGPPSLGTSNVNNTTFGSLGGSVQQPYFETDLDLHFSLQYPHFIKRDGNRFVLSLFFPLYLCAFD